MADVAKQLEKLLNEQIETDGKSSKVLEMVLKILLSKALKGDIKAINAILDRTMGKPQQQLEVSGKDDKPINFDASKSIQEIDRRVAEIIGARAATISTPSTED